MNSNDLMKDFEKQLQAALEAEKFPTEEIGSKFLRAGVMAFQSKSIMGVGCNLPTYFKIVQSLDPAVVPDWDLYSISFVINTIETSKPSELAVDLLGYVEILTETRKMAELWNDLVLPIKAALLEKNTPKPNFKKNGKSVIPLKNGRR